MAGLRSNLFDYIDDLDGAADVESLVKRLKPLLYLLAYSYVHSDAAAVEDNDAWHDAFAAELNRGASADGAFAAKPNRGASADGAPAPPALAPPHKPRRAGKKGRDREAKRASGSSALKAREPSRRDAESALPPSLLQILKGTHASLGDSDSD